jgi:hypothetical protein
MAVDLTLIGSLATARSRAAEDRPPAWAEVALAAATLAALAVFVAVGADRSVWLDEANSILIASRDFPGIAESLSRDNNLPAYYYLLALWIRIFGDSPVVLRLLSGVLYLGGGLAVFAVGRRLFGDLRTGAYCAFFYLVQGLAIRQAQNIRMYALLGLVSALSTGALLRARKREGGWRPWRAVVAVDAAGCFVHVWFAFVLGAQLVAILLFDRRLVGRFLVAATAAAAPFAALWGPAFLGQIRNGATNWMPELRPETAAAAPLEFFGPLASPVIYAVTLALAIRDGWWRKTRFRILATIIVVSIGAPIVVSLVRPIYWPGRYMIIAAPPVAWLVGWTLSNRSPRLLLAGVCWVMLGYRVERQIDTRDEVPEAQLPPGQSDRTSIDFIRAHSKPGDAIVFTSLTRAPAEYYLRREGAMGRYRLISFPAENALHLGWADSSLSPPRRASLAAEADRLAPELFGVAAKGGRVWIYDGYSTGINRILRDRLASGLPAPREHELSGPYHTRILEYSSGAILKE